MIATTSYRTLAPRIGAILGAALLATATPASAGPGDNGGYWQDWGGFFVSRYNDTGDGNIEVSFVDGNGQEKRSWYTPGSTACSNNPWLRLAKEHPEREGIKKALIAAGLSQRPVYILMQAGTDGFCYLKRIRIEFRKPSS